jgi:hypothetical protein
MAMFGIIALFSAIVLYLYLRLQTINPLEKLVYWFCAVIMGSFIFSIEELNLELLTTSKQWSSFLNARMSEFLFHGVGIALYVAVLGSSVMKQGRRWAILLIYPIGARWPHNGDKLALGDIHRNIIQGSNCLSTHIVKFTNMFNLD